jgi:hypothetical protein
MAMRRVYTCDICGNEQKHPNALFGVHFSTLDKFTLGCYGSTEGKHICWRCAKQLRDALVGKPITEELARQEAAEAGNSAPNK